MSDRQPPGDKVPGLRKEGELKMDKQEQRWEELFQERVQELIAVENSLETSVPCPMRACPDIRCDCKGSGFMPKEQALAWLECELEILEK